jgi:hypothetical protein
VFAGLFVLAQAGAARGDCRVQFFFCFCFDFGRRRKLLTWIFAGLGPMLPRPAATRVSLQSIASSRQTTKMKMNDH